MTASPDHQPTTGRSASRRTLLAGALAGIGAWAASAVGRASPVMAGVDGDVVLGGTNNATTVTTITNASNTATVIAANAYNYGIAVAGDSPAGYGVKGTSASSVGVSGASQSSYGVRGQSDTSIGVYGFSGAFSGVQGVSSASDQPAVRAIQGSDSTAVLGFSGSTTIPQAKPKTGVYGHANQDAGSKGVWGFSGRGAGVYGQANRAGYALRGRGRVKFEKVSGVATIEPGNTAVTISPQVKVTSSSFVLLTPRANIGSRGLWYTTNPSADTIRLHISSARSSATRIAWLLLG